MAGIAISRGVELRDTDEPKKGPKSCENSHERIEYDRLSVSARSLSSLLTKPM